MLAASTIELGLRMMVSLVLMGVVTLVAFKVLRGRLKLGPARSGISVEHRHQLNRSASVAVIRAGRRRFLIGVNEQSITLLAEGDDLVADAPPGPGATTQLRAAGADGQPTSDAGKRHRRAANSAPSGMSVIEALREKTVRR